VISTQGVEPNVVTYTIAMDALGRAGRWDQASDLLEQMVKRGIAMDAVSYRTALNSCGKAEDWDRVSRLLEVRHGRAWLVPTG
jgi:pentatricopeptide repeat protein